MRFRSATAGIVVLAVTTVLAQQSSPITATAGAPVINQQNSLAGKGRVSSLAGPKTAGVQTPSTLRERVQDMEGTLAKMHALLKQMRAKAASSSQDPFAKANLDMWELMVGHLDKQFEELRLAMLAREDMDARRAALYKQADAKADAAARAARGLSAGQADTAVHVGQGAAQSAGAQPAAGQPSATPPTTPSPN